MMNEKTFRLFIASLLICSAPFIPHLPGGSSAIAATETLPQSEKPEDAANVFRGIYLSADLFGYIYPIFVKDKYYSAEVAASVNLNNRFFPVVEAGIGHTDIISHLYDIGYRTRAPYYRIGMDYNMQYQNGKPNYIYLGGRMGYTSFEYSVDAPPLDDPIWGTESPVKFTDVPCRALWVEAVAGVRAEILKNLYLGWSLRYKYPLKKEPITNGGPWYIPGFGASSGAAFGATYSVTYYLNFTKRRP